MGDEISNTRFTVSTLNGTVEKRQAISKNTACLLKRPARCLFHDPFVQMVDEEVVDDEVREAAIGMTVDWRLVYVVYVFREDVVRIISARPATKIERRHYEEQ